MASVLAVVANFVHLSTLSQLSDEPVYLHAAWRYIHGQTQPLIKLGSGQWRIPYPDNYEHPPLAKYLFGLGQAIVGRQSVTADRAVSAACTLLTAVVVAWWLAQVANRWVGLLGGTLIALLPEHGLVPDSMGRHGMLEPVAALFMTSSVILAWWWFSTRSLRWSWLLAVATGLAAGLATSAKEIAFLAALGPVIIGIILSGDRRQVMLRSVQAACAAAITAGTFLALYVPIGPPATLIDYMLDTQTKHQQCGHPIEVAGHIYRFPPWWANLWFAYHGLGAAVTITLITLAACAVALRRDRLVAWLVAALAGPLIFLCFVSDVSLPYYWTLLTALFFALAALGAAALAQSARRRVTPAAWASAIALVAALAVLGIAFGQMISSVATLRPSGVKMVRTVTQRLDLHRSGVVIGVPMVTLREYVPQSRLISTLPKTLINIDWIVAAPNIGRSPVDPGVRALLAANQRAHNVTAVYSDSSLTLYKVTAPLTRPTQAQINAQPPTMQACPTPTSPR